MPDSRSRRFSRLAKDVSVTGNVTADGLAEGAGGSSLSVYDSASLLPITGLTAGDQAWAGNRLYISNGSGWYNVALVNADPRFISVTDSDGIETPYALSIEGTPITITLVGADSDGSGISYSYTKDAGFDGLATISGTGSQYTVTPLSQDSATTTSGTVTFKVSDGISFDTSVNTFTLNFVSPLWKNVVASIGHSDSQGATTAAVADRSGNSNTPTVGSANGYPAQGSFHPYLDNWSVYFDGADDYLSVAASSDFAYGSGDFTFECWINTDNSDYFSVWQNSGVSATANNSRYFFGVSTSGNISLSRHAGGGGIASTGGEVTTGVWHHIAAVRESGTVSLYCDGSRVATGTTGWSGFGISDGYEHTIGYRVTPNYGGGFISDLRILNGTALYSGTSYTVPTEPLTAITNTVLLTCQSNRFVDNSSSGRTVTPNNGPAVKAYNPYGQESEYARANYKGSILNTTTGGYLSYNGSSLDFTQDWTIEFWVYHDGSAVGANTVGTINAGSGIDGLYFLHSGGFYITVNGSGWSMAYTGATSIIKRYAWHHCAMTWDGATYTVWIDGVSRSSFNSTSPVSFSSQNIGVGARSDGADKWGGYISDFKISIGSAKYTSTFTPPTSPVGTSDAAIYWPMDNAYIYDKAGNSNILNNSSTVDSTYSKFGSFAYKGARFNLPIGIEADKWTLEFWWRGTGSGDYFNLYNSAGTIKMRLLMQIDYGTNYTYRLGFTGGVSNKSGGQFANGWNHVALVKNGGTTVYLYENGAYKGSQSYGSEDITSSGGYIVFGNAHWYENIQFLVGTAKYTGTSGSFTAPTVEQGYGTQTTGAAS